MATQLLLPNAIVASDNLNANISNLDEGVDNFDGVYATAQGGNGNTLLGLGFPSPPGVLNTGAGLQTFRARVRRNDSGGNTTTVRLEVRENQVIRANSDNFTITSTTGVDISYNWDASVLSLLSGEEAEIYIVQQAGGQGGAPGNRRWIEIDTADWIADYAEAVTPEVVFATIIE